MKGKRGPGIIIPTYIETNGSVKHFLKLAQAPETQKAYQRLLKDLKAKPEEAAKKLREVTWGRKSVDEVMVELEKG